MAVPAAGQTIKASDAFQMNTYTPTLSNITVGTSASLEGWYQQIGQAVLWGFRLEFGTGSPAFGTAGNALVSLPVTAYTGGLLGLDMCIGSWIYRDGGLLHYAGSLGCFESAGINASASGAWDSTAVRPHRRVGNDGAAGTTYPQGITVGSGDVFSGSGWYRAA
jgi:hypothetical protein